ncbi:hypothetical protein ScalyP_jg2443 [Parmales sp. scaly parma]|nr:hypothetical protein ScalyP_jg2443 [Parmales sp. scaly parma]|tara:strand:+ start:47 stop:433 length:387 start_codon:yes stop_codon:yes gene_type:complete
MPTPKQLAKVRDFVQTPDFVVHEVVEVDDSDCDSVETTDSHQNQSYTLHDSIGRRIDEEVKKNSDKISSEFLSDLINEREEAAQWEEIDRNNKMKEGSERISSNEPTQEVPTITEKMMSSSVSYDTVD